MKYTNTTDVQLRGWIEVLKEIRKDLSRGGYSNQMCTSLIFEMEIELGVREYEKR